MCVSKTFLPKERQYLKLLSRRSGLGHSFHNDIAGSAEFLANELVCGFQMSKEAQNFRYCLLSDLFLSALLFFSDPQPCLAHTWPHSKVRRYIRSHYLRRSLARIGTPLYLEVIHLVSGPVVHHPLFWSRKRLASAPHPFFYNLLTQVYVTGVLPACLCPALLLGLNLSHVRGQWSILEHV